MMMSEPEYRNLLAQVYESLEQAFRDIDPDVAECETVQGALSITLEGKKKIILSAQPSVRQLWLAYASKGVAYHFNFEPTRKVWIDEKNPNCELYQFLNQIFLEEIKVKLNLNQ